MESDWNLPMKAGELLVVNDTVQYSRGPGFGTLATPKYCLNCFLLGLGSRKSPANTVMRRRRLLSYLYKTEFHPIFDSHA